MSFRDPSPPTDKSDDFFGLLFFITAVVAFIGIIAFFCWAWPSWAVWQQGMTGRAELARAEYNRRIAAYDAQASVQRAEGQASAEVARARGNAQANQIIAGGLGGPSGYLEYLYIQALRDHQGAVIYVPTEAGLPILEAGRDRTQRGN